MFGLELTNSVFTESGSLQNNIDPMPFDDYREITELSRMVKETIESSFKLTSEKQFIVNFNHVDNQAR